MNTVYGLVDPMTKELKYIGVSSKPKERLRDHIASYKRETPVGVWVRGLREQCTVPEMIEIESGLNSEKGAESERFWMNYFIALGSQLLNIRLTGNFAALSVDVPAAWYEYYGFHGAFEPYNELFDNSQPF